MSASKEMSLAPSIGLTEEVIVSKQPIGDSVNRQFPHLDDLKYLWKQGLPILSEPEIHTSGEITPEQVMAFCADFPLGPERFARFNKRDEIVSSHELEHHGLIAYGLGVAVRRISIKRIPGVHEGVTEVVALPSDEHRIQVIAAGGGVHGMGAESDMAKVGALYQSGGMPVDSALSMAREFVRRIDPEVRKIANQILAYRKEITGAEIPEILNRARWEVKYNDQEKKKNGILPPERPEGTLTEEEFDAFVQTISDANDALPEEAGVVRVTKIVTEHLDNGKIRTYQVVNGEIDRQSIKEYCSGCGMQKGHPAECKFLGSDEKPDEILIMPDNDLDYLTGK